MQGHLQRKLLGHRSPGTSTGGSASSAATQAWHTTATTQAWQTTALNNGGRRMLSTGGARSSQRKRHRTRRLLRTVRDGVVGFGWLSQWLRR